MDSVYILHNGGYKRIVVMQ